ncbi:MAG: DNA polymerase III subunit gamma/tau [Pseudomonadota bacterium]
MSYLVLARKYRPQRFSELVGQEHVARTLTNAIAQNRVHHAFLFTGARGVGKTSAARILAKALSCEKGPTAEPCGVCDICQEIAGGRSVDVIEIDAASNTKVEETKAVLEGVRYLPARARRKVYIIDEVHMLSAHSWNALLKTLEEPPPHVVFVFATTEAHKIPGTILSRCQRFDFKLIPTARLATHLDEILRVEKIDAAPEAVRLIARQAAGSVRDGLSLLDQTIAYVGAERLTAEIAADVLGVADRQLLLGLAAAVLDRDGASALRLIARAVDRGVDLGQLGRAFLQFLRDLEVASSVKPVAGVELTDLIDATPEEMDDLRALAARMPAGLATVLFDRWARALDEASRLPAPRLLYEMAAIDLCAAEPMLPLGELLQRLDDLESRLRGSRPPGSAAPPTRGPTRSTQPGPPPSPSPPPVDAAPVPATPAPAAPPAPLPSAAVETLAADEAWRRVLAAFEKKSLSLGAMLAHADVVSLNDGSITLAFPQRFDADRADRNRAEIEAVVSSVLGRVAKLTVTTAASGKPATIRSEVRQETDAVSADRREREAEARQHPLIRRAQDVFGASLKEIKT